MTKATAPEATAPSRAEEIGAFSGDPDFMASLARGLAVIRAFSGVDGGQSIAQLSKSTGIPRAAVRRCLYTLAQLGYVGGEDGRLFRLAPAVLSLGYAYVTSAPLAVLAQPLLDRVSGLINEACSLAVLDGDEVVYIARSKAARRIMSVDLGVGSHLPAYCTSLGRVLLAGLDQDQLDGYFSRVTPVRHSALTKTSQDEVRHAVTAARDQGHAIVDQELEMGLISIAVPVRNRNGRVVAAMNVGSQASRLSAADMTAKLLPHLAHAAWELGLVLSV